jgi:hypothetical protein
LAKQGRSHRSRVRLLGAVLAAVCGVAGFGAGSALADHEHTYALWLHGLVYGDADAYVHAHLHSTDGAWRTSYVAGGLCPPYSSHDAEREHLGANNGIDKAMGSVSEYYAFASTRSPQTGLDHHHHTHYFGTGECLD